MQTTKGKAELLGSHPASTVFLTATVAIGPSANGVTETVVAPPAQAHHFFTKLKAAQLSDPQIEVVFKGLTATVTSKSPAPYVFLDPGELRGHFSDNGFLLLPGVPKVLEFDAMGEDVTAETLRAHAVVRSPWSTVHPIC